MSAKILIVDDEVNVLRMLGYALEAQGYEVLVAESGKDALTKVLAVSERPDLMILDINLPDISGVEICQQLRSKPETADLPIIMLSARTQVAHKITGLQAGADEYVTKPFDSDEMLARVAALLDRTRRLRQVQPREAGKVLGFIGAKGGVGTTTVALNVALALSVEDKNIILVELRPFFGTLAVQLGQVPVENLRSLLELESERINERALRNCLVKSQFGLKILFGPQRQDGFKGIKPEQSEAVIRELAGMAHYAIVDLPCDFSDATRAAIRGCDFLVLIAERVGSCLVSARATLDLLRSWGVSEETVGAVIVDRTGSPVPVKSPEIESELGCRIVGVFPPAEEACMIAERLNTPIVVSQEDSVAASALRDAAKAIVELLNGAAKKGAYAR